MKNILFTAVIFLLGFIATAQEKKVTIGEYELKIKNSIPTAPVKSQGRTGTCWSFATTSFIEAEIIRQKGETPDISEMYFVRHAYEQKADNYVRFGGKTNFGPGGQAHDVMHIVKTHGMAPESVYSGQAYGYDEHNHDELNTVLSQFVEGVVKSSRNGLTTVWPNAFSGILDAYLGEEMTDFSFEGKTYTPQTFAAEMQIIPQDYVELTSYNHQAFYAPFLLKVPDNWSFDSYYNLPLDVLMETVNHALDNGYTICWDGDVSDEYFSHKRGLAIVPDESQLAGKNPLIEQAKEKNITQADRQIAYNTHMVTDDHLMHITGYARGKDGTIYYQVKNSWGVSSNELGGVLYMSEQYFRLATIAVMVHKEAIPETTRKKTGI